MLLNCFEGFRLFEEEVSPDNEWCVNVNIHITSDEEIKEGDPRINNYQRKPKGEEIPSKKIILTTDQDLIKDGVQKIDDEFLEWFVKNPSCEEVEVDKAEHGMYKDDVYYKLSNKIFYKTIIQKEEETKCYCGHTTTCDCGPEEPNQETLEEFIKSYINRIDRSEDGLIEQCLNDAAKWQMERSYSEEEVDVLVSLLKQTTEYEVLQSFRDKVEQFKKK
jgi:acetone carboxylase gamma subunit